MDVQHISIDWCHLALVYVYYLFDMVQCPSLLAVKLKQYWWDMGYFHLKCLLFLPQLNEVIKGASVCNCSKVTRWLANWQESTGFLFPSIPFFLFCCIDRIALKCFQFFLHSMSLLTGGRHWKSCYRKRYMPPEACLKHGCSIYCWFK